METEYETTSGPPRRIGKYQITEVLGKGAMGVVYKALDPHIQRTVALKTINKAILDSAEKQALLVRFRQEAQAAGKLSHPNVVGVFEYGEGQDSPYIVMEYVEGRELKNYLTEGVRFSLQEAVNIIGQILDVLTYCHSRGVIHRDLKPGNIFLLEGGQVKIADFGIARIDTSTLTQTGAVLGTPSYMSPEQFMGQPVDARTDLYSAGMVLYEILTGENPYAGQSATAIMHKLLSSEPIGPAKLNLNLPDAFNPLMRKALAKKPAGRFQSAQEFKRALDLAARDKGFDAEEKQTGLTLRAPPAPRRRLLLISAAAVLAVSATGLGVWWSSYQPSSTLAPRIPPPAVTPGLVRVISVPPGAAILIDGQFVGFTPSDIEKQPGDYSIVLKKADYQDLQAKLVVEPSADVDFDVILEPAE